MHVLLLAKKNPWPPKDGEAIAILQMAKGLTANGNRVTVIYMNTPKHHFDAWEIPPISEEPIFFEGIWVDSTIKPLAAFLNIFKKTPYHVERFFNQNYLNKVLALVQREHFDIIHAEGLYLVQYLPIIKKNTTAKSVYRSHNRESEIWANLAVHTSNTFKKWYMQLQAKKLKRYEKNTTKQLDAVVPISLTDAIYYKEFIADEKVFYSPTGIDPDNIPVNFQEPESNDLYFIGGLDWLPNTEGLTWFIKSIFPAIKKLFPEIQLHIAGRNAPIWLAQLHKPGIVFHGEVQDAILFIRNKFINIVPLLSGSGMKLKILEAMAAGKQVITTPKGADGMPAGISEHIAIAESAEDFIELLAQLITNKQQTLKHAKIAKEFAIQHLNNTALTHQLTQFYSTL